MKKNRLDDSSPALKEIVEAVHSKEDNASKILSLLEKAGNDASQYAWDALRASFYDNRHHYTAHDALYNEALLSNVQPLIDALTPGQKNELLTQAFRNFAANKRSHYPDDSYNSKKFVEKASYLIDQVGDPEVKDKVCIDCAVTAEPAGFAHLVKGIKNQSALDEALIKIAASSKTHLGTWERTNILAESSKTALANLKTLLHGESRALVVASPQNMLQRLTAIARDEPHLLEQGGMTTEEITKLQHMLHIESPSGSTAMVAASAQPGALTEAESRSLMAKAVGVLSGLYAEAHVIPMQRQQKFKDEVLFRALQEAILRPNPQAVNELANVIGKQNKEILNWPMTKSGQTIIDQAHGTHKEIPEGSSFIAAAALHGSALSNGYGYPIPLGHNLHEAVTIMVKALVKNGASCQSDMHHQCPIEILQHSANKKVFEPGRLLEDMHDARARELENQQLKSLADMVVDSLLNELDRRNMDVAAEKVTAIVEGILAALDQARFQGVGAHSRKIRQSTRPGISDQREHDR